MNSSKTVIRITEHGDLPGDYDKIFYVEKVITDINGRLKVVLTGNIWDAMKMTPYYVSSTDVLEDNTIKTFIEFVKSCFIPKHKYTIELIKINLDY